MSPIVVDIPSPVRPGTAVACGCLLGLFALFSAAGCVHTSESGETASGTVAEAPSKSEERPVWAEGPVDDRTSATRADSNRSGGEGEETGPRPTDGKGVQSLEESFPNEHVTLDFQRTDVRRVLRLFQAKASVDVVVDDAVEGKITVQMQEVPIDEAFRAVLRAAELGYERSGGGIVVRPK